MHLSEECEPPSPQCIPRFVQQLVKKLTWRGVGSPEVTSGQIAHRDLVGNGTSQAGWDRNPGLLNSLEVNGEVLCQGSAEEAGVLRQAVAFSIRQKNRVTTPGLHWRRTHCLSDPRSSWQHLLSLLVKAFHAFYRSRNFFTKLRLLDRILSRLNPIRTHIDTPCYKVHLGLRLPDPRRH